jgi:hypothetical protein
MNINMQSAQTRMDIAIEAIGEEVQWLVRTTTGSSVFDTSNQYTFGYGDVIEIFTTGSLKCILHNIDPVNILIEPGHYTKDYRTAYFKSDSTIEHLDRLIIPSGSGILYQVQPINNWYEQGVLISKSALCIRLLPQSGSVY